ncbi:ATP-binding protein [Pseudobacteriovorax antillogorgiicola]|uniref:histidine kinase n=1 Tax=Pseudobacteriovorax antillogorgiicola TaxID=1513793 RepID=A0A1Y6CA29_9BACT|nr:ATP-binding protein [Pseudobacteriovorax antillogorgiicola]TCS49896.1 HAMP domain-containing protein [Pseudobacteriovorax antillogorgiicola]SMF44717.1 Hpt domain-containing protein [Pseudobacteriovorax antillogorgiicola]
MKSIKNKIVASSLLGIFSVLVISSVMVALFSDNLITNFLNKGNEATNQFIGDFKQASQVTQNEIIEIYEEQARKKGLNLIAKDRMSLTTPFVDNQVLFIQEFISESLKLDDDIIFAAFYVVEGEDIRATKISTPQYPNGLPKGLKFNSDIDTWVGEDFEFEDGNLPGIIQRKTSGIEQVSFTYTTASGETRVVQAYDVATPVFEGEPDEIDDLMEEGEAVGYLRYVISLEKTNKFVQKTKDDLAKIIGKQEERTNTTREELIRLGKDSENQLFLALAGSAVLMTILGFAISAFVAGKISKPVTYLSKAAQEIASGHYESKVKKMSDDEIGQLCEIFENMRVQVKDFTENLQFMVDEKTKEIRFLLDNIDIAIFKIMPDKQLGDEYSKAAKQMFGDLKGKSTNEVFKALHSERTPEILDTMINEDDLTYEANSSLLPLSLKTKKNYLELSYSPHYGPEGQVSSVLVTVKDVTEVNKLKAKAEEEAEKGRFILNIASHGPENVRRFIKNEISLLEQSKDANKIQRILHTVKGNSLAYGFKDLGDHIHEFESKLQKIEGDEFVAKGQEYCQKTIMLYKGLEKTVNLYFPSSDSMGLHSRANLYLSAISELSINDNPHLQELRDIFYDKCYISFNEILDFVRKPLEPLSKRLKKPTPNLEFSDSFWLKREIEHNFRGVLNHIIRNALDHGIEEPKIRKKKGKDERGTLKFTFETKEGAGLITVQDDGAGIDLRKISERRSLSPDTTLNEIAREIFKAGFSTKDDVTEISGRGVGMDAVKVDIEELGGSIELKILSPRNGEETLQEMEEDTVPFAIIIGVPDAYIGNKNNPNNQLVA